MMYYKSIEVISPKRNLKNVIDIHQNKNFALAKVTWNGSDKIAIRWNVTENELKNNEKASGKVKCIGEPNSRGYPTWFILPDDFLEALVNDTKLAEDLRNILKEKLVKKS